MDEVTMYRSLSGRAFASRREALADELAYISEKHVNNILCTDTPEEVIQKFARVLIDRWYVVLHTLSHMPFVVAQEGGGSGVSVDTKNTLAQFFDRVKDYMWKDEDQARFSADKPAPHGGVDPV